MDIGVKLDIGFPRDPSARRLFTARHPLELLSELGVRAVETAVAPNADFGALADYAQMCCERGLRVSLHPYTEGTPFNPARFSRDDESCRRFHARVFLAAEETARRQGDRTIVNIHAAAGEKGEERRALVEESVRFFSWAKQWCEENAPSVEPVVELQFRPYPNETIQRIGDVYVELREVAERADVGICWDIGHAHMNACRFGLPLQLPEELWGRVAHIHCHDADEIDHFPLVFGRVPWGEMLSAAVRRGFNGTVVLEVPPENYLKTGGLSALVQSVEKLKAVSTARLGA